MRLWNANLRMNKKVLQRLFEVRIGEELVNKVVGYVHLYTEGKIFNFNKVK